MRRAAVSALLVLLAAPLTLPGTAAQQEPASSLLPPEVAAKEAATEEAPKTFEWGGAVSILANAASGAAFGSPDQPDPGSDYFWGEGYVSIGLTWRPAGWVTIDAAGGASFTLGDDVYGSDTDGKALVERLSVAFPDIGGSGISITAGRQNLKIGDGFLVSDGYRDEKTAGYLVPFSFFDALVVDWEREGFAVKALGGLLGNTTYDYSQEDGYFGGADLSWSKGEEGPGLGVLYLARADSGPLDNDAEALSVRGSLPVGPVTFNGEYAWEFGSIGPSTYDASAWNAAVRWTLPSEFESYLRLRYAFFSGDDPRTEDQEAYYAWFYGKDGWSEWYIGELVGSTLNDNTDEKVLWLEGAWSPSDVLILRALVHRIWVDTGAYHEVPEGAGNEFADELDLNFEWTINDSWGLWGYLGWARPLDAAKASYGDDSFLGGAVVLDWTF